MAIGCEEAQDAGTTKNSQNVEIRGGETGYLIVFYAGEGQCDTFSLRTGSDGKLTELPTATRADYNFLGWYTEDGTQITTETVFTGDAVVTAKWEAIPAIITVTGKGSTDYCYIYTNSILNMVVSAQTLSLERGSTVTCVVKNGAVAAGTGTVTLNGETVLSNEGSYKYTVKGNATIDMSYSSRGHITIKET